MFAVRSLCHPSRLPDIHRIIIELRGSRHSHSNTYLNHTGDENSMYQRSTGKRPPERLERPARRNAPLVHSACSGGGRAVAPHPGDAARAHQDRSVQGVGRRSEAGPAREEGQARSTKLHTKHQT